MRECDAASGPIARDKAGLHPMRVGVISVVFRQLLIGLASLEREPANRRSSAARAWGQEHPMKTPTHEAVAHCAHQLWQDSGCVEGRDLDYWIEAEQILIADASAKTTVPVQHRGSASGQIPGESPADHSRNDAAAAQKHEARAAKVPHKSAPHATVPETGKPLWSQPHSR